jgi:hypothetical protein
LLVHKTISNNQCLKRGRISELGHAHSLRVTIHILPSPTISTQQSRDAYRLRRRATSLGSSAAIPTAADARSSGGGPHRLALSRGYPPAAKAWTSDGSEGHLARPGPAAGAPVVGHLAVAVYQAEPPVDVFIKSGHHSLSRAAGELTLESLTFLPAGANRLRLRRA